MQRFLQRTLFVACLSPTSILAQVAPSEAFPEYLIQSVVEREGDDTTSFDDETARNLLLIEPTSPYSELRSSPLSGNEAWTEAAAKLGITDAEAMHVYTRRMGLTKARPGIDVNVHASYESLDPFVGASATKAAVDRDIFDQALTNAGFSKSAIAANFAVGAQILRDLLGTVPEEQHDEQNLRKDVLERFMALKPFQDVDEYDGDYLLRMLRSKITDFVPGTSPSLAVPYIPAQFRVARVASAYHDMTGYFGGSPCNQDMSFNPSFAGTGQEGDKRALCFIDANDQAVHAWYLKQLDDHVRGIKRYPDARRESVLIKLMKPVAIIGEIAGMASFINLTTGIRAFGKGLIKPISVKNMYRKLSTRMCKG